MQLVWSVVAPFRLVKGGRSIAAIQLLDVATVQNNCEMNERLSFLAARWIISHIFKTNFAAVKRSLTQTTKLPNPSRRGGLRPQRGGLLHYKSSPRIPPLASMLYKSAVI